MSEYTKKSEKLASAVYFLTGFFDDREPLKWRLRTLASEFISLGILVKDNFVTRHETITLKMRSLVSEITGLFSIAKNVGLISDDNHSLLHQEFVKYLDFLGLPPGISERSGQAVFSSDFFITESGGTERSEKTESLLLKDKTFDKGQSQALSLRQLGNQPSRIVEDRDKIGKLREFGAVLVKKNSRQSIIISILKRKREVMIKDVSPLISGCSEKTIQRELSAMVQAGVLKKTGDKRWSRYTLA